MAVFLFWRRENDCISLGEIIEKYGKPDLVSLDQLGPSEAPLGQVNLYRDSLRMSVGMPPIDTDAYRLEERTRVKGLSFSDKAPYQAYSELEFGSFYQRWKGYGTYQP